jgi:hypothetical protein
VPENRISMRIFGPKRAKETGGCRKRHNEMLQQILFGRSNQENEGIAAQERYGMHTKF